MAGNHFTPFPELNTERLRLRKIVPSDVNEMLFLRSDPTVMQYIDRERAKNAEDAMKFITLIDELEKKDSAVNWGITLQGDNKIIGNICIWKISWENMRAEVGYVLHPTFHRKGIMNEALNAAVSFGFNKLKLHSIEANVNPLNEASMKLLEKNKFRREAYFRENYYFNGKFLDSVIYARLEND